MLILYPVFFVCVEPLWFSTYKIISSENRDNFTFSFPVWIPFISCPFGLTRTLCTQLGRSSESGHPRLVTDLKVSFPDSIRFQLTDHLP